MTKSRKRKRLKRILFSIVGTIVLIILVLVGNLIIFEKNASVISKGEPIEMIGEVHPALLVIDIQEATTGEISLVQHYIDESEVLINQVNQLTEAFIKQNIPIIYIRSEITNPLINLLNSSYAKGSLGAKFDKRLKIVSPTEIVKSRNDAFYNTTLDEVLVKNKINELYIVGLDAAHCINITIEAAKNRNYKIKIIKDAVLSESVAMKDSMFVEFEKRGVELVNMDNL